MSGYKKCLVLAGVGFAVFFSALGLGSLKNDFNDAYVEAYGSEEDRLPKYFLQEIETVPEGWSVTKYEKYYYEIDTKIVYISNQYERFELKSEEYRNYVYDAENNKFIGVK